MSIRYWVVTGTGRIGLCRPGRNSRSFPLFHQHAPWQRQRKGSAARWIGIQTSPDDLTVKCTMKPQQKLGVTWGWWFLAIYEALSQKIVGWLWWTLLLATGFRVFLEVFLRVFLVFHGGSAFRKLKDDKNIHLEGKEVMWHSVVSRKPKNKSNR